MTAIDRVLHSPAVRRSPALRSLFNGFWLGWQIETNWADPLVFVIYFIARPVAALTILVVMYSVIARDIIGTPYFAYVYLGGALYLLAGQIVVGVSWVVVEDREQYRVAKQIYTAPIDEYAYLMGRGLARFIVGVLSVSITIPFGIIVFGLPVTLTEIDVALFVVSTLLGLVAMAGLGVVIGSYTYQITRQPFSIGDTVSGALYLLTGAVFPIDLLPEFLRPLSYALPSTYWLELARRALISDPVPFQAISSLNTETLLLILVGMAVLFVIASVVVFRWSMRVAKERGVLDMESNY